LLPCLRSESAHNCDGQVHPDDGAPETYSDTRAWQAENIAANKPVVDLLKRVAQQENATPAQVALAWLLARRPWIVPITRNIKHFEENLQAVNVQLSPVDLSEIEVAVAKLTVHGGRMNAMQMQMVDES